MEIHVDFRFEPQPELSDTVSQIAKETFRFENQLLRSKAVDSTAMETPNNHNGILASLHSMITRTFLDSNASRLPSRRWVVLLAIAAFVAIEASGYLGWVALTSSKIAGCGGGKLFNCGHVISSRWSLWMGIPVSLLAVGMYLGLAVALFVGASTKYSNRVRHAGWAMVSIFAIAAGLAAIWFISLQVFVLKHLCIYCLVAHTCGLIAAGVVLWTRPIGWSGLKPATFLSVVGVAILIGGQLLTPEPEKFRIETFETPAASSPTAPTFDAPTFQAPVFQPPTFDPPAEASEKKPTAATPLPSAGQLRNAIAWISQPSLLLTTKLTQGTQQSETGSANQQQTESTTETKPAPTTNPTAQSPAVEKRTVAINGGTMQLDVSQWPIAGSKKAKYIFVEMFDYSCPHCRNTHASIKGASEKLAAEGHELAVLTLPIPLAAACNNTIQVTDPKFAESCEIAKLAVAVWRVDAKKFTDFHHWMISTKQAPTYAMAKAHADNLVDKEKLNAEIASQVPAQYVAKMVELYKLAGSGNVPKLIFPTTTVVGEFTSGDSLVDIIKQQIK